MDVLRRLTRIHRLDVRDAMFLPFIVSAGRKYPSRLTSSSPSRAEDSFCKTAMSRREDIVSCIDVTIMDRSAHSALPSSYSKIFPAFGAGAAFTHATAPWQTSRNAGRGMHATPRVSLSLAGLKASVSRGEIG